MSDGDQRLTAEQRRTLEEEEARREAEYAAETARQRARMEAEGEDRYVTRRMEREVQAIAEAQRTAEEEETAQTAGARLPSAYALLLLGFMVSGLLLVLIWALGRHHF